MRGLKVLSLYCGAGGIDEGLKQAGIKTTLAIDYEKDCIETMKLNHDCETICAKVEDIESSLSGFDIIIGGPPCPEFSRAKVSRTLDPIEVNRFWSIIDRVNPRYYMMENVQDVIQVCNRKNYLINCADYGIPQTRIRRIFTNLSIPKQTHAKIEQFDLVGGVVKKWVSVKDALGFDGILQDRKSTFGEGFRDYDINKPSFTLMTDCRVWLVTDLKNKNTVYFDKHPPNNITKPSSTILGKDRGTEGYITDNQYARKLTNEECAILQGFPKSYKFFGNKTSVRRQIGNAVPPQVIKVFFQQVTLPLIRDVPQ